MHTHLTRDHLQACIDVQATLSQKARERLEWLVYYCDHGGNVRETCQHFSLPLVTLYRLLHRFQPSDPTTLEDLTRRPHVVRIATNMPPAPMIPPTGVGMPALVSAPEHCSHPHCLFCKLHSMKLREKLWNFFLVGSVLVNIAFISFLLTLAFFEGRSASARLGGETSFHRLP